MSYAPTITTKRDFINTVYNKNSCNFYSDNLKVQVKRLRTSPIEFHAYFYHNKDGAFQKFFTSVSTCVADIVEDIKSEFKIYGLCE